MRGRGKNCRVEQLCNSSDPAGERELHRVIFDAATAFTNVRRLQILRRLAGGDVVDLRTLGRELSMSGSAASRHVVPTPPEQGNLLVAQASCL